MPKSTGCIIWPGPVQGSGYPGLRVKKRLVYIHRLLAAGMAGKRLRKRDVVMHSCDNPLCINPNHLTVGTFRRNMADKVKKGRQAKAHRVLSLAAQRELHLHLRFGVSQAYVARQFGITKQAVNYYARKLDSALALV